MSCWESARELVEAVPSNRRAALVQEVRACGKIWDREQGLTQIDVAFS